MMPSRKLRRALANPPERGIVTYEIDTPDASAAFWRAELQRQLERRATDGYLPW